MYGFDLTDIVSLGVGIWIGTTSTGSYYFHKTVDFIKQKINRT